MASQADTPSGGGFDADAVLKLIDGEIGNVEASWDGKVRVGADGRKIMLHFARTSLAVLAEQGLPPGIDSYALARQATAMTREYLWLIRTDAQESGTLRRVNGGMLELPSGLIAAGLEGFAAARCLCWPQ